jgi:copper(I)-binding protein
MRTGRSTAGLFVALLALHGCSRPRGGLDGALQVEAAVARLAPGGVGAAYLEITNRTDSDDRLVAVDAADVGSTGLHEVVTSGDVARMVARPEGFVIRSGETLELRRGGKHVMLFGVQRAGDRRSIPLTLHFERGRTMDVDARVLFAVSGE